jgi:hypothetical protein
MIEFRKKCLICSKILNLDHHPIGKGWVDLVSQQQMAVQN